MEKSIESIWKEGFLNPDQLVVPKLNDLYNQKSIHIIDKIMRMGKINLIYIGVLAFILLIGPILMGAPYLGISLFFLVIVHLILGLKHSKLIKKIDKNVNSYEYIKAFDNCLKDSISDYILLNRFFYPLFFLAFIVQGRFTSAGEALIRFLIEKNPDTPLLYGIPIFLVVAVLLFTALLAIFGGLLYKIDLKIVYGRVLKKLNEIVSDMEELRR